MRPLTLVLPFFLLVSGCASTERDSYEARQRALGEQMVKSAQDFSDKLTADAEAKIADYGRRLETWKPQLREYYACNSKASRIVATQPGDPMPLAVAARNLCRDDEMKLRRAVYAAYSDNPNFGIEAMEKVRRTALENNTGEIVAHRVKSSSPSAPTRPSQLPPVDRRI